MKVLKTIVELLWLGTLIMFTTFSFFSLSEGDTEKFALNTIMLVGLTLGFWAGYLR